MLDCLITKSESFQLYSFLRNSIFSAQKTLNRHILLLLLLLLNLMRLSVYIYIYICVCVCVRAHTVLFPFMYNTQYLCQTALLLTSTRTHRSILTGLSHHCVYCDTPITINYTLSNI